MLNFYIAAFLADLALGAVLLSIPLLLIYKFDASSITLGLLGALGAFVYSSGVMIAGSLADRFNRKNIMISGCVLFVVVYAILPFLPRVGHIFLVYVFGSASMSMFWPTLQSWLSQGLDKEKMMRSLSNFNVCWSGGLTFGFLFAGILFSVNQKAPFIFGVLLMAAVIFFLIRQPVLSETEDGLVRRVFLETEKDRPKEAKRFLYIAWCANFMSWYILGTMRNLFPKLGTELGFSSVAIGFLIFLMITAQVVMFFVLGRTHKWHYRLFPIILFQALAAVSLAVLALSSDFRYFMAAAVFLGLSGGMTYFSSIFYSLYGFIDKGKRSGIHEVFIGTGSFFGPFIGGFAAGSLGLRAPYILAACLVAAVIVLELVLGRKRVTRSYEKA